MALFESYERRIEKINAVLAQYGINGIEEAKAICDAKGIEPVEALEKSKGSYGRFKDAVKYIDPRHE